MSDIDVHRKLNALDCRLKALECQLHNHPPAESSLLGVPLSRVEFTEQDRLRMDSIEQQLHELEDMVKHLSETP